MDIKQVVKNRGGKAYWRSDYGCRALKKYCDLLEGTYPLIEVLCSVDSTDKSAKGFIYETHAKERFLSAFYGIR